MVYGLSFDSLFLKKNIDLDILPFLPPAAALLLSLFPLELHLHWLLRNINIKAVKTKRLKWMFEFTAGLCWS